MHQWKEVTLDEIADLTVGFVGKTATHYVGEGIRFLRSMNVEPFRINYNDPKFIDQEFHNKIKIQGMLLLLGQVSQEHARLFHKNWENGIVQI